MRPVYVMLAMVAMAAVPVALLLHVVSLRLAPLLAH